MKAKKGKKGNQADALIAKKTKIVAKKVNPFELHRNKEKFRVLNQRTTHSNGKPFLSRQIAFDKRKQTIGVEYNLKNKTNVFQDNRRSNFKAAKESIYNLSENLNDSEVLTHRGQTLSEIERFDDVVADEDEMSDDEARLDAKFTAAAHFGGGESEDRRNRKTVIEELIAESKKRKVERAREHEQILDMTDKLDSDWRELTAVVNKLHDKDREKPEQDDYDRLVKEMIFAPRGEPTNKLRDEEEVARIEKERLEQLERERLARMRGEENEEEKQQQTNHRSADDLDDGYFLEPMMDDGDNGEDKVVSYSINPEEEAPQSEDVPEVDEANEEEQSEEESASDEESEVDSLDDLKASESEDEPEDDTKVLKISEEVKKPVKEAPVEPQEPKLSKKLTEALEKIPFTIAMPASYEAMCELLESQPIKVQATIIERVMKTNHPRLLHANRSKMLKLFAYLLQYVNDLFSKTGENNVKKQFKLLHELVPLMFDLIHMNPEEGSKCFLEVLKEKYEDYKKNQKRFPPLDTLVFFKILGYLFPCSDFRHPITTPAYVFIHHILSRAKVRSRSDIAAGLFLVTLVLDYQQLSKKFLPAVMNFLCGICYLGVNSSIVDHLKPIPPFKKNEKLLVIESDFEDDFDPLSKLKPSDFMENSIDDDFKVRALNAAVNLTSDFVQLYDELVGLKYFLEPFLSVLSRLIDEEFLPVALRDRIKQVIGDFRKIQLDKKFRFPVPERKVQPMIRLLEPRFETVLSDRRTMYSQNQGPKAEQQKLKHMIKRETKSAKRELRRDNEFISKLRHKRAHEMDQERKAKVKRIFNEASVQQSEFNALSRTKGRKVKF